MINKVELLGYVGADPEVKTLESGKKVANIRLATNENYKKDGETQEKTTWHNLTAWGKNAENIQNWVKRGQLLFIEGKLVYPNWEDENGSKRYGVTINVDKFKMLPTGAKKEQNVDPGENKIPQEQIPPKEEADDLPF